MNSIDLMGLQDQPVGYGGPAVSSRGLRGLDRVPLDSIVVYRPIRLRDALELPDVRPNERFVPLDRDLANEECYENVNTAVDTFRKELDAQIDHLISADSESLIHPGITAGGTLNAARRGIAAVRVVNGVAGWLAENAAALALRGMDAAAYGAVIGGVIGATVSVFTSTAMSAALNPLLKSATNAVMERLRTDQLNDCDRRFQVHRPPLDLSDAGLNQ
jgi:hypothetical protein